MYVQAAYPACGCLECLLLTTHKHPGGTCKCTCMHKLQMGVEQGRLTSHTFGLFARPHRPVPWQDALLVPESKDNVTLAIKAFP